MLPLVQLGQTAAVPVQVEVANGDVDAVPADEDHVPGPAKAAADELEPAAGALSGQGEAGHVAEESDDGQLGGLDQDGW